MYVDTAQIIKKLSCTLFRYLSNAKCRTATALQCSVYSHHSICYKAKVNCNFLFDFKHLSFAVFYKLTNYV